MRSMTQTQIACGERIPRGWGYVRDADYSDRIYIAPIPLNFVFGAWYWFYFRVLIRGMKDPLAGMRHYWRGKGWHEGYQDGYEAGIKHAAFALESENLAKNVSFSDYTREDLPQGTAADADRPRGIIGRSVDSVVLDDPISTSCTGCYSTPCICEELTSEVPTRTQARRSKLRSDVLDHSDLPGANSVPIVALKKRRKRNATRVANRRVVTNDGTLYHD